MMGEPLMGKGGFYQSVRFSDAGKVAQSASLSWRRIWTIPKTFFPRLFISPVYAINMYRRCHPRYGSW